MALLDLAAAEGTQGDAGIADLDVPEVDQTPALAQRRDAVAELGDAMRGLIAAAVASEVPADQLRDVTSEVRRLSGTLAAISRPVGRPSSVDDLRRGVAHRGTVKLH